MSAPAAPPPGGSPPIGVGVIGQGFMGKTHLAAYRAAQGAGLPCRVVAVADLDPGRHGAGTAGGAGVASVGNLATGAQGSPPPEGHRQYQSATELIADPEISLVSVCTPTDTHVELSIAALESGKHVLVEKPVALDPAQVRRVADAAERAGRVCIPAMVMRFWPGWPWLRERIRDGSLGALRSLVLQRVSSGPTWSPEFYKNPARTGGALTDLHIHDADFVLWCLGRPDSVISTGTIDHVTTIYRFASGPSHVVAHGAWDYQSGFSFRMRYTANFERGTADFDLARGRPLLLVRDGIAQPVLLPHATGYESEVLDALETVLALREGRTRAPGATIGDAAEVAELLLLERRSLETGCAASYGTPVG